MERVLKTGDIVFQKGFPEEDFEVMKDYWINDLPMIEIHRVRSREEVTRGHYPEHRFVFKKRVFKDYDPNQQPFTDDDI